MWKISVTLERERGRERWIIMGCPYCLDNNTHTMVHLTLFQYQIVALLGPKAQTHPHVPPSLSNLLLRYEVATFVVGYLACYYVVCNHSL